MKQLTISYVGPWLIYLSLVYVAFILPFHGPHIPIGIGIGVAALGWLLEGGFSQKFKSLLQNKFALLFIAVYLLYFLSITYSQNKSEAISDLQLKLSLLLFPLIISTTHSINQKRLVNILRAFVTGCLLSAVICFCRAAYLFITDGDNQFLYDKLAFFVQVGYYAMYLTLAAILVVYDWATRVRRFSLLHSASLFLLGFMLILLSARAQLAAFLLILPVFGFVFMKKKWGTFKALGVSAAIVLVFVGIIASQPAAKARLQLAYTDLTRKDIDKHSPYLNGINTRFLIWEVGIDILKDNPIIGIGAGDVEDELLARAEAQDIPSILDKELNFHSQFFQTAVALGLLGLLVFLLSLFAPLVVSLKKEMLVYTAFIALIMLSAITEAIFERQAGVIFFAFFNSLLFFKLPELTEPS